MRRTSTAAAATAVFAMIVACGGRPAPQQRQAAIAPQQPQPPPPGCRTLSADDPLLIKFQQKNCLPRQEMKQLLTGLSAEDLKKVLGPPDRAAAAADGANWFYRGHQFTIDPASNRVDRHLSVFV